MHWRQPGLLRVGAGLHIAKHQPGPLGGTGWKGCTDFLLGELSAGLFLWVGGSLQPRVQDRAGPLGEQQPAELVVKIHPKGAAQHYNSARPTGSPC